MPSSKHDKAIAVMTSQLLWIPACDRAHKHLAMDRWMGSSPSLKSYEQLLDAAEGELLQEAMVKPRESQNQTKNKQEDMTIGSGNMLGQGDGRKGNKRKQGGECD